MLGWILMPKLKFIAPESPGSAGHVSTPPTPVTESRLALPLAEPVPAALARPALRLVVPVEDGSFDAWMRRKWGAPKAVCDDVHAAELLAWLQGEGNADSKDYGAAYVIDHAEAVAAYHEMCMELFLQPVEWNKVAVHFNRMTGGKKYRNAPNPADGGRRTAKVRIYRIPAAEPERMAA